MRSFITPLTAVLLLPVCLLQVGCTHNTTTLDAEGNVRQVTSPANTSRMGPDGTQQATNLGIGPLLAKLDADGIWANNPGPSGLMGCKTENILMFLMTPQDAVMTGVEFTPAPAPGQPAFKAATLSFNLSEPMKQQVIAFVQAAQSLEGMTKTEAEARVAQMEAAGEITKDIAALLLQYVLPTLTP